MRTLLLITYALSQTVGDIIASRPDLTEIAAELKNFPAWSSNTANVTLFVGLDAKATTGSAGPILGSNKRNRNNPGVESSNNDNSDQILDVQKVDNFIPNALAAKPTGYFYIQEQIDVRDTPYTLIKDYKQDSLAIEFYPEDSRVLIRYGDVQQPILESIKATNGYVYVVQRFIQYSYLTDTLNNTNYTRFLDLLQKCNLTSYVNGLKDSTLYVPTNAALETAVDIPTLNFNQTQRLVYYHIVPQMMHSTRLIPGPYPTLLKNQSIDLKVLSNGIGINDAIITVGDLYVNGAMFHVIDKVLRPKELGDGLVVPDVPGEQRVKIKINNGSVGYFVVWGMILPLLVLIY